MPTKCFSKFSVDSTPAFSFTLQMVSDCFAMFKTKIKNFLLNMFVNMLKNKTIWIIEEGQKKEKVL